MTGKNTILAAIASLVALAGLPPAASACTTFAIGQGGATLVGKSYDWHTAHGLALVNKRGVAKQALVLGLPEGVRGARWISRHGSLTFNQYGREMPNGGINERGLVVEVMWLGSTRHGALDRRRRVVNELQWIQYLLDTCATLQEAVAAARRLQVARIHGDVHYLVCDRGGACATFEYLAGELVIHHGKGLPARVLTNSTYARSASALGRFRGFGGEASAPAGNSSLARFVRAASLVRAAPRRPTVAAAFEVLDSVRQGHYTRWQIVYQPGAGRVHFRQPGRGPTRILDLSKLDFSCESPVTLMDLHGTVLGAGGTKNKLGKARPAPLSSRLVPYTRAHNLKLIRLSAAKLGRGFSQALLDRLAAYPETATRCTRP